MGAVEEAEALEDEGDWEGAIERYRRALDTASGPEDVIRLNLRIALSEIRGGDPDEAEDALAAAERTKDAAQVPESLRAEIAMARGEVAEYQGHLRTMRGHFETARSHVAAIGASLHEIDLRLARADIRTSDLAGAVDRLEGVVASGDLDPEIRSRLLDVLGRLLLERGEAFAAMKVLEKAVSLDDQTEGEYAATESRLLLAQACLLSGSRHRAARLLGQVRETFSGSENHRDLSELRALEGLLEEERGEFEKATRFYRNSNDADIRSRDLIGQARALRAIGRIYLKRRVLELAGENFEDARNRLADTDDRVEMLELTCEEAALVLAEDDYEGAIDKFEDALRQAEVIGDPRRLAIVKRGLAGPVREIGEVTRSLQLLEEARRSLLELTNDPVAQRIDALLAKLNLPAVTASERGDLRELEELLDELGEALLEAGRYREAIEVLLESERLDEFLETSRERRSRTIVLLGRAHARIGQREEASKYFSRADGLYLGGELSPLSQEVGRSEALFGLGAWLVEEGRLSEAHEKFREVLRIEQHKADRVNVARAHRSIAAIYRRKGDLVRATEHLKDARRALAAVVDRAEMAELERESALIAADRGEFKTAAYASDRARELSEGSEIATALCDHVEAQVAMAQGDYPRATILLEAARHVFERRDDLPELDDIWDDIGEVRLHRDDLEGAEAAVRRSLELGKAMGWNSGRGRSLLLLARIAFRSDLDLAERHVREALGAFADDQVGKSESRKFLAEILERRGDLDRALQELREGRRLDQELGNRRGIAECSRRLGLLYMRRREWVRAEEAFEQADEQLELAQAPYQRALVQIDFGEYWLTRGLPEQAVRYLDKAQEEIESQSVIESIPGSQREVQRLHRSLIRALRASGDLAQALRLMRRVDAERSEVWRAVIWELHPEIEKAAEQFFSEGNYRAAVKEAFQRIEEELRRNVPGQIETGKHYELGALARRLEKEYPDLSRLVLAANRFVRNPVVHKQFDLSGVDALACLLLAHLVMSAISADPKVNDVSELADRRRPESGEL